MKMSRVTRPDDKRLKAEWSDAARQKSICKRKARQHLRMCRLVAAIIENPYVLELHGRLRSREICRLARENGIDVCERSIYYYLEKLGISGKTKQIGKRQYDKLDKFKPKPTGEPRGTFVY